MENTERENVMQSEAEACVNAAAAEEAAAEAAGKTGKAAPADDASMLMLKKIDEIIDRTGVGYKEAYDALLKADGDVVQALIQMEEKAAGGQKKTAKLSAAWEYIKEIVRKGNVSRISIKKGEETILSLPFNAGLVGAVLFPWAMLASTAAAFGTKCTIELIKDNGDVVRVSEKANDAFDVVVSKTGVVFEEIKDKSAVIYSAAKEKGGAFYEVAKEKGGAFYETAKEKGGAFYEAAKEKGSDLAEMAKKKAADLKNKSAAADAVTSIDIDLSDVDLDDMSADEDISIDAADVKIEAEEAVFAEIPAEEKSEAESPEAEAEAAAKAEEPAVKQE